MEPVSTRISEEDEALLSELEAELGAERSAVLRQLVRDGLDDWRRERALEQLREHAVTVREAAEVASVEYVELLELAAEAGIDLGDYDAATLTRDLDRV